ncbi:ribonuclease P protein subunit p29-like [Mya arenaria]|uniref:ribonuclease P protein subunit p29-like n=1 Tax=Mya arenaria TaxID=6604 RepID=UPI0022E59B17|nr:ribonuclease P protein subunit p29-like [Mya arenaria]
MELYKKLPKAINVTSTKEKTSGKPIKQHLKDCIPARHRGLDDLEVKCHVLDSVRKKWKRPEKGKGRNTLSIRDKRELKVFEMKRDGHRFEDYLPLHELWQDYMRDILDVSRYSSADRRQYQMNNERLLKADYHGCYIVVRSSRCPSLVGLAGIVVMETKNMVKVIGKDNRLKSIPKMHSVFSFELDGFLFTIHGNNFCVSAFQRSKRKFKQKATVEL